MHQDDQKPRERLLRFGSRALYDEELIALLLRTGSKEKNVYQLSRDILEVLESIHDIRHMSLAEFMQIKGIKLAKATTLVAAIELGRRMAMKKTQKIQYIKSAKDVYDLVYPDIGHHSQEHLIGLYLNTKGVVIHQAMIFKGTVNQTLIHPREMFKHAIRVGATSVIFAHNHPSGDVTPSQADIDVTKDLMTIGQMLSIQVVDHIIIGEQQYYSLKTSQMYDVSII